MNQNQRTTILLLWLGLLAAAWPQALFAQTSGPWPPSLGAYFWRGIDGSGDGSTTDWEWEGPWMGGRWYAEGDEGCTEGCLPPVYYQLPPEDGDALRFQHGFTDPDAAPYSIAGGSHVLPNSGVYFAINATISGGFFDVGAIGIATFDGASFPITFNGTTLSANTISAIAGDDTLTFIGATLESPYITLVGGGVGMPAIHIHDGSHVNGSIAEISRASGDYGPSLVHVDDSEIELLGMAIGLNDLDEEDYAELWLTGGSMASFAQFLLVGAEGSGRLVLDGSSQVDAGQAYVNIGEQGWGDLYVTQSSTLEVKDLNVGLLAQGNVSVDSGGRITSENGTIGLVAGFEGTVNLESDGSWETEELTLGESGTGYLYVREGGILSISGEGVLGMNEGSRGVVNLIGAAAEMEVGATGSLVIGKEGLGDLYLSEGSTFSSLGDVTLAEDEGGEGLVVVDGAGSTWFADGGLTIGGAGTGSVAVENGGTLVVNAPEIALGEEDSGVGVFTISTPSASVVFSGELIAGVVGNGVFALQAGASHTAHSIILGEESSGTGILNVDTGSRLAVTMDLTAGDGGEATINLTSGSFLNTFGEAVLAEKVGATATVIIDSESTWQANGVTVASQGIAGLSVQGSGQLIALEEVTVAEHLGSGGFIGVDGAESALYTAALNVGGSEELPNEPGGMAVVSATNEGQIFVSHELTTWDNATVDATDGSVTIGDETPVAEHGSHRVNEHGLLAGTGTIAGAVSNDAGEVSPGHEVFPGTLSIQGDFTQSAGGTLLFEIAGEDPSLVDQLSIAGSATLGGMLTVSLLEGFMPVLGDTFNLVFATGGVDENFNQLDLPDPAAGFDWQLDASGDSLILSVVSAGVPGDYNGDDIVDAADYTVWRNTLGGINLAADGNRDGSVDELDYAVWKTNFGQVAGVDSGSAGASTFPAAVPEPATWVLLFATGLIIFVRRQAACS